ncbi:hypothetical protein AB0I49_26795 [Streptomyces sp. NPDC050617]|uniref:hypothetical protein n=1 Tax=Streptomyces sp. NPDC050617 TaxID=3154628 RepID=UPI0034176F29
MSYDAARVDAARAGGDRYVLVSVTYEIAAGAIGRLIAGMREASASSMYLLSLPAWEVEALASVLRTFHRAVAGDLKAAEGRRPSFHARTGDPLPAARNRGSWVSGPYAYG